MNQPSPGPLLWLWIGVRFNEHGRGPPISHSFVGGAASSFHLEERQSLDWEERLPAFYIIEGLFVLESEGVLRGAHALEVRITLTNVGISLPMATATGPSARSLLPERLLSFLPSKLHSCPTIAHKRQPFGPMANQYRTLGRSSESKWSSKNVPTSVDALRWLVKVIWPFGPTLPLGSLILL